MKPSHFNSGAQVSTKKIRHFGLPGGLVSQAGFTLIEMIAVIIIISTIGAVVYPSLKFDDFNLESGAEVVANDIRTTQMAAMNTHQRLSVTIAPGVTSYTYGTGRSRDLTGINQYLQVGAGSAITFNSLGEPVGFTTAQTITIVSGGSSYSFTIEPYTGKVTLP